ncbi:MAG: TraR/DksA C4-type zinc finger protein [bacterium]|nr:TraR/DksA C4-type zinc finger protein [bacterium]
MNREEDEPVRDAAYFKEALLKLRSELRQIDKMGDAGTAIVELDQSRVGRLSRMDAMQDQAMSLESKRRRQVQLQRIASALQRLERDEFGFCLECGSEIPSKRLSFDPTTLYCMDCASEKGQ